MARLSIFFCIYVLAVFSVAVIAQGCTISFQNISTHGTATDLVDENQRADANVRANVQLPKPMKVFAQK